MQRGMRKVPACVLCVIGLITLIVPLPAHAQSLAWQSQVTTQVPAGADVSMANAALGNPSVSPAVALVTVETGVDDRYQYRAIATDPDDGSQLWSTDLGPACGTRSSAYNLVVPLPGGDVIISAQGANDVSSSLVTFTCILRLSGSDGQVVWSSPQRAADIKLDLYAIQIDNGGQIIATGRKGNDAIVMRLDAASGSTIWKRQIPADSGSSLRGIAAVSGSNDTTVVHLLSQSSIGPNTLKLAGISTASGSNRWSMSQCPGGTYVAYQSSSNDIRLRMLADNSVEFVSQCVVDQIRTVEIGRINALTGVPVWRRTVTDSSQYRAVVDVDGYLYAEGKLTIDTLAVDLARLSPVDGSLMWSLAQTPLPPVPPTGPSLSRRIVAEGAYLHALELNDFLGYVKTATIATYAAANGTLLGRYNVDLPPSENSLTDTFSMAAFGNGEVLIGTASGRNRYVGLRLSETRLQALTGVTSWSQQTPIMAPHPFIPMEAFQSTRQMVWNGKGSPGILLAGRGVNPENYNYPRISKLSAQDGRVLWRWEPDKRVNGNIVAALSDAQGDVIIAGSNGWDDPTMLLAKLDGSSGAQIWESSSPPQRPALDAALAADGAIMLLLGREEDVNGATMRVARYSASNGSEVWSVPMPEGWDQEIGQQRIALATDGSVLATSNFTNADYSLTGVQVVRFRASDGVLQWRRKLPGVAGSTTALLLPLANGDLAVGTGNIVWHIDGATGVIEWQKTLSFSPWSIILDAQGGLIAGGASADHREVTKLNASNGVILWSRELPFVDATSYSELASALSLSSDGDILVAGGDGNGNDRTLLAKLRTSDGATLWELATTATTTTASSQQPTGRSGDYPIGVLESPDRNIYFSGLVEWDSTSWTLSRVTGSFADGIFASGFD